MASEQRLAQRRIAMQQLKLRELAHAKLDEALDLYVSGVDLGIHTTCSWSSTRFPGAKLDIYILDEYA